MSAATSQTVGLVTSLTRFVDSQTESLAVGAYQALGTPGSTLWLTLTAFLTILTAVFGYNLLLGHAPSLRGGVVTMARIGIVLALATSWPAYQTLIYDVVIDGPGEISAELGQPVGLPGADNMLTQRLDLVDATLVKLAVLGPGPFPPNMQDGSGAYVAPPPFIGFNAFALGAGRIVFLLAAIGSLIAVRVVAGLMLALGPFFIAFLLFSNTRSLFEGWIRVLAGAAIGSLGLSLVLGLQLMLLDPWLSQALSRRIAGESMPSLPSDLFVIIMLFAIVIVAVIFAIFRMCAAFRLTPVAEINRWIDAPASAVPAETTELTLAGTRRDLRSRTELIADHMATVQMRERVPAPASRIVMTADGFTGSRSEQTGEPIRGLAVGRSAARRTRQRISASSERRDAIG